MWHQTLTRVSISKNSRREMIQIFLSRSREANFHVSFSSRFSRIGGKVSLSPLNFQDLRKMSPSPLNFQDFVDLISLSRRRAKETARTLTWREQQPFYFRFLFSKVEYFSNFSFSSRNWARKFEISLSPLETGKRNSGFSFSSWNWARKFEISL